MSATKPQKRPPPAVVLSPMRVEPRAYMANERTLLSWLHMSALLATVATGIVALADTSEMKLTGILVGAPAVLFICHAVVLYFRRLRDLNRKTLTSLDEQRGPWLILVSMVTVVLVNLGLVLWRFFSVGGKPSDTFVYGYSPD